MAAVVGGLGIAAVASRGSSSRDSWRQWSFRSDAFLAGSAIYLGSYALLHNYDYRLVCLVLTLPQLMEWAARGGRSVTFPRVGLVLVLGALLTAARDSYGFPYDETVTWRVFVWLSAALLTDVAGRGAASAKFGGSATPQ